MGPALLGRRTRWEQDTLGYPGIPEGLLASLGSLREQTRTRSRSILFFSLSFSVLQCGTGHLGSSPQSQETPYAERCAQAPGAAGCAARCGGAGTGCALHCCKNALLVSVRLGNPRELYCWRCGFVGTELGYGIARTRLVNIPSGIVKRATECE